MKILTYLIIAVILFIVFLWYLRENRKAIQTKKYHEACYTSKYYWLQSLMREKLKSIDQYEFIKDQLLKLGQMEYKNPEKTQTLTMEFDRKLLK